MAEAKSEVAAPAVADAKGDANFMVYSDDACLGKLAPRMAPLEFIHRDAVEVGKKITAVLFWAKFAKGDYTTVNDFSRIADENPEVQFVGVSCDPKKEEAIKFVKKIGTFQPELGESGLTIEANFPLAYDPDRELMRAYKSTSKLISLGVGMTYIIDSEGTIVWREQFTRGKSTMGQFEEQLKRLQAGKALIDNGPDPSNDESEDEATFTPTEKIVIPGEEADY